MGMRMRLKSSFDISGFPPQSKVILKALQQYGMIMADNGSSIYISGTPDDGWDNDDLGALKSVPASAFEVLLISPLYTENNIPQGANPTIASFTAKPQKVSPGAPVTGQEYNIISPQVGVVAGTSLVVTPPKTTTYTLYSTNQFSMGGAPRR
jgi:hypothetical protein